ncbi:MAG: hypothetical protein ACOCQR_03355 [bacterium]
MVIVVAFIFMKEEQKKEMRKLVLKPYVFSSFEAVKQKRVEAMSYRLEGDEFMAKQLEDKANREVLSLIAWH